MGSLVTQRFSRLKTAPTGQDRLRQLLFRLSPPGPHKNIDWPCLSNGKVMSAKD